MLEKKVDCCDNCPVRGGGPCPFTPKHVEPGQVVTHQGEVPERLAFVKEGVFSSSVSDSSGTQLAAGVRGPRALLGVEALTARPARATVVALQPSVVCSADAARLREYTGLDANGTGAHPGVASALLGSVLEEFERSQRDASLRTGPALTRVARFLGEWSELVEPGRRAPFSLRSVAALLDLRPETLSRCLRKLTTSGLIEVGPPLEVLDAAGLREVADGGA